MNLDSATRRPHPLGKVGPHRFLRHHWQKRPLFLSAVVDEVHRMLSPADLMSLACDERCRSRLVLTRGSHWRVEHGPFDRRRLQRLPSRGWALLVQDVNLVSQEAHDLMMRFDFIPYARMDDLMVSLAPEGGGVGPHVDSYDVFLLQGSGSRRWDISSGADHSLRDGLPLRILRNFTPDHSMLCSPGDLLYLPPGVAHHGIALETCMTYSVGFRSPSFQELMSGFLAHLDDGLPPTDLYADPDLPLQNSAAMIPRALLDAMRSHVDRLDLSASNIRHYLGGYLTEPQPHVVFESPRRPLSRASFKSLILLKGARLCLATRMLWTGNEVFINGERVVTALPIKAQLVQLADRRAWAPGTDLAEETLDLAYDWYRAGYLLPRHIARRQRHFP